MGMERIEVEVNYAAHAPIDDISKVLTSVLESFEESCGLRINRLLRVEFWESPPIVSYQLDPDGRTRVFLSASDSFWCQYAYQFSHEICHIATNFDRAVRLANPFGWLDETVCELGALATLRGLARKWRSSPPVNLQPAYSQRVREYREDIIKGYKQKLDSRPFKTWFSSELPSLRTNSIQREKNAKIAFEIMPFFHEGGSGWGAAAVLNLWHVNPGVSIKEFFDGWAQAALAEAETVRQIAGKFPI
jgi:hypothetical protein